MRTRQFLFAAALLACITCSAQTAVAPAKPQTAGEMQLFRDLIAYPDFIRSVARANQMTDGRFFTQDTGSQREMIQQYIAQAGGLQAFARSGCEARGAEGTR